jgi:FMN reductase
MEFEGAGRGDIQSPARSAPLIVGIGGTTRPDSSSERALMVCLRAAEAAGARTMLFSGGRLNLPLYDPTTAERSAEATALVAAFRMCDGLIISSPAYHGTISGLVKNALDYAEDLRTDERGYFDGVAVGCIACGAGWQAAVQTLSCLRTIVHCLRGWPTPFGAALNTVQKLFDSNGECLDPAVASQLELIARQVCDFTQASRRRA